MWLVSLILLSSTKSKKCERHETPTLVPSMSVIVVRGLMNLMEIVVDAVAEISEVEAVVEVAVEDAADSTTMEATEIVIQDGVTEVVVRVVILVDEVLAPHNAVAPDQSHLETLTLQYVGIDPPLVVLLHLVKVALALALLYHQPTGDSLHRVGRPHPVDMLHLLLLVLHHPAVGGHGHHLLLLLVTESVVSKTLGEVGAHLRPDVVGCLQGPHLIPTADPSLLPASTLEGGVQALLQGKEVRALVDVEGVLQSQGLHHLSPNAEVQVLKGKDLENMPDDEASAGAETVNLNLILLVIDAIPT